MFSNGYYTIHAVSPSYLPRPHHTSPRPTKNYLPPQPPPFPLLFTPTCQPTTTVVQTRSARHARRPAITALHIPLSQPFRYRIVSHPITQMPLYTYWGWLEFVSSICEPSIQRRQQWLPNGQSWKPSPARIRKYPIASQRNLQYLSSPNWPHPPRCPRF